MPGILWRILIAIVCVWALNALIGPVLRLIGLGPLNADAETVIRICSGLIALAYIFFGRWPTTRIVP